MPASAEPRVALYFDFDNIVISRYDQLHGDFAYRKDTSRSKAPTAGTKTAEKLREATVDIDAVLDFAATFGTIAIARAYADWSTPVNASYRGQLIDRAVDLVQLFPLSATKNGADIRLAVDAVEDMFRIDDLTHIVIVAGDSDYVALAQKAKRLGRYVVGIGVAGGTSRALTAAVDEFADYDALLSTDAAVDDEADVVERAPEAAPRRRRASTKQPDAAADAAPEASPRSSRRARSQPKEDAKSAAEADETPAEPAERPSARVIQFVAPTDHVPDEATGSPRNPGRLLLKAIELLRSKNDEEWQSSSAVKNQMLRMDPSFQERRLGFASFSEFLKSRGGVVELDETGRGRVRIRTNKD
ncbi:NYN domain-containing protein [Agromyces sp. H3Y2-19a]|uniref:NYN domain-containing protein n=1 Tax=Agromyces TaxID=33877 RepID=UPI001E53037A|nr:MULTISPECIES: NYN domain-containing protein [Agromyces]MCD5345170.1 NYN domain-containing protein [Agromyces sp. S2-1-8]MDF0513670.1 NYN domain-containing protein [Agromyces chromiiresistens]